MFTTAPGLFPSLHISTRHVLPIGASEYGQEMTRYSRAHNRRPSNVAMIVGRAGAGKSTLANKILDHPDYDVFEEGHGTAAVTAKTSRGGVYHGRTL